jgi:hypothetical protein
MLGIRLLNVLLRPTKRVMIMQKDQLSKEEGNILNFYLYYTMMILQSLDLATEIFELLVTLGDHNIV